MAIIKFISTLHPTKSHTTGNLKNCIDYIMNEEKTEHQILVGTQNCIKGHVLEDFTDTMSAYGKLNLSNVHSRLGYHFCISFKKGEQITNETALNVVKEFCEEYMPEHEAVFSAHTDREHIHCHICFNAVSFSTGYKYRYEDGDWAKKVQPLLDAICIRNNLPTLEMDCGIPIEEYEKDRKKRKRKKADGSHNNRDYSGEADNPDYGRNDMMKNDIDESIYLSNSFDEFLAHLKERGYLVKYGKNIKYMALKAPGDSQYRRVYKLEESGFYSEEKIRLRIMENNKGEVEFPVNEEYRYILPEKFRYIPKQFKKYNSIEKMYYAKMYRLGMAKKSYRISYREIKMHMQKIDDISRKLSIISQCSESDDTISGLNSYLSETKLRSDNLKNILKEVRVIKKNMRNKLSDGNLQENLKNIEELKEKEKTIKKELREVAGYEELIEQIQDEIYENNSSELQEIYNEIEKEENEMKERKINNESVRKTGKKRTT